MARTGLEPGERRPCAFSTLAPLSGEGRKENAGCAECCPARHANCYASASCDAAVRDDHIQIRPQRTAKEETRSSGESVERDTRDYCCCREAVRNGSGVGHHLGESLPVE